MRKVVVGDRVALQCGAQPSPALELQEIVWYRDGQPLPVARLIASAKTQKSVSDVFTLGKAARAIIGWVRRESWKCSVLILMLVVGTVFYGSVSVDRKF